VKEFHRQGKSVSVWTVDDPADMRRLAAWGVNGIISNKPDLCLKTLKEIGKH
jgi:glycerophosphoryl diester phosphodiesterase